jgi:hypothetical protein
MLTFIGKYMQIKNTGNKILAVKLAMIKIIITFKIGEVGSEEQYYNY